MYHYTREELITALHASGLEKGDTVFFFTSLGMLGLGEGVTSQDAMCEFFLESVKEVLGTEGTMLVPAYSYTIGGGGTFDPLQTKSQIGMFPEYFRKQPGVIRSLDPMLSVCALGPKGAELFDNLPNTTYGAGSIWERLLNSSVKLCNVGIGTRMAAFIHYADWLMKVPFRYDKLFSGKVIVDGTERDVQWVYAVRAWHESCSPNTTTLGNDSLKDGLWKQAPVGRGSIFTTDYDAYFTYTVEKIKSDPWYTATGTAGDVVALERERVGAAKQELPFEVTTTAELIAAINKTSFDIITSSYRKVLASLCTGEAFSIKKYPSGSEYFTWLTPEEWTPKSATLKSMDGTTLFSFSDNEKHLASYSLPCKKRVPREELFEHLYTDVQNKSEVPFVSKRYQRNWGLCCSEQQKKTLTDEFYDVEIQTDFSYGTLDVAEYIHQGKSDAAVVIYANIRRENFTNGNCAGALCLLQLLKEVKKLETNLSYIFILAPQTIGSAAWLSEKRERKIIGGLYLGELGTAGEKLSLTSAFEKADPFNNTVEEAFRENITSLSPFRAESSDTNMFNALGIPMLSLITDQSMGAFDQAVFEEVCRKVTSAISSIDAAATTLEAAHTKRTATVPTGSYKKNFEGELFIPRYSSFYNYEYLAELHLLCHYINGLNSIKELATKSGISETVVKDIVNRLEIEGLITTE